MFADDLGDSTPDELVAIISDGQDEASILFVLDLLRDDLLSMGTDHPELPQAVTAAQYIARRLQRDGSDPIRIARDGFAALLDTH